MRGLFLIPLILIILGTAGYLFYNNSFVRNQISNLSAPTNNLNRAPDQVTIKNFGFSPQTVTIRVGDSVTWTNNDSSTHTATSNDGLWDSNTIPAEQSKSVQFNSAGTYKYNCRLHPGMTGTVIVR